jgi:hypothetical protein
MPLADASSQQSPSHFDAGLVANGSVASRNSALFLMMTSPENQIAENRVI